MRFIINSVIMLNIVSLVLGTHFIAEDVFAKYASDENGDIGTVRFFRVFEVLELSFLIVYMVELFIRIAADRIDFICGPDKAWNCFDACLVALSLCEYALASF